jgi:Bacterial Ig domain/Concanavalin A-like lectin/glucanases superfamily
VMKLYVNGKLEGSTAYAGAWAANGTLNVGRGKWGGAQNDWLAGAVDEVKAYSVALTDADVSQLYNQVVPASTPAATAVACANEGGTCALPTGTTATVWYGANVTWAAKAGVTGSIGCNNTVFGDPVAGVAKSCKYLVTSTANLAPTVSLSAPINNASFDQGVTITLNASAADSDGSITKVSFYDGATLLATGTAAPYSFAWSNATLGTHTLTAQATDNQGVVTTSAAVTVTVTSPNTPPNTATSCANEGGTCTLPTGTTATVWYGANTKWAVKTGLTGSIGCNNTVFGDPVAGVVKSCKYLVTNWPPTVSLSAPANNASFEQGTAITISASAADTDGAIAKVDFYDGTTLLASSTVAPYSTVWSNASAGAHALTAQATDNTGKVSTSATVNITVTAPAKPLSTATSCANEGGTCTLPTGLKATVWYGANTSWAVKTGVTGSIACTNAVFGDPAYGTAKTCRYQ